MKSEADIQHALCRWILSTSESVALDHFDERTLLFAEGVLESVHVMDLILLIEELSQREIDIESLEAGAMRSVATIYANFFGGGRNDAG